MLSLSERHHFIHQLCLPKPKKKRSTVAARNKELEKTGERLKCFGMTFRILPDDAQQMTINQTIGCHRLMANLYLSARRDAYLIDKTTLSVAVFKKEVFPVLKTERPYLKGVDKFALETACEQVDEAFNRFFKKLGGYPKFKKKHASKQSYTTKYTNNNIKVVVKDATVFVQVPKLGLIPLFPKKTNSERIAGILDGSLSIKTATVTRRATGYTVSLSVQQVVDIPEAVDLTALDLSQQQACVGIDLGLKTFAVTHDGHVFDEYHHQAYIKNAEKKLAKAQRNLARKKPGSNNYEKQRAVVAKLHAHVANQRKDFHHKLSTRLADTYDIIVVEDLNIRGMIKNRKLSKAIANAGWSQFTRFLAYKQDWRGHLLVKIGRFFASSKLCADCGHKYVELTLDERHWACSHCGTVHDRDHNASRNIRNEGLRLIFA